MNADWMMKVGVIVGIILLISLFLRKILLFVHGKALQSEKVFWKKMDKILYLPFQVALWGGAFTYILEQLELIDGINRWRASWIVVCLFWMVLLYVKEVLIAYIKSRSHSTAGALAAHVIGKIISLFLVFSGILTILSIFHISIAPFLTFGGIGIAACAFAAQDIIANFFGGMILLFSDAFSIGDRVVIPSLQNFEGMITEIGWYRTTAEDYYRRPVYFPNSLFTNARVINESRKTHRVIKGTLTLRYQDLPLVEAILDEMRGCIRSLPKIDETKTFSIQVSNFDKRGIEVSYFVVSNETSSDRFAVVKQNVYLMMNDVIVKCGAQMAYQIYNLRIHSTQKNQKITES